MSNLTTLPHVNAKSAGVLATQRGTVALSLAALTAVTLLTPVLTAQQPPVLVLTAKALIMFSIEDVLSINLRQR